jgi:hypothetical protein
MKPRITLVLCLVLTTACGKMQSQVTFDTPVEQPPPVTKLEDHSCEWDPVDYELNAHLLGFEMEDKKEGRFGFGLNFLRLFKINFNIKTGKMTFTMNLSKPQNSSGEILHSSGDGPFKASGYGFEFSFANISLGIDSEKNTPIKKMIVDGLTNALKDMKTQLAQLPSEWATHIQSIHDGNIVRIPVGSIAGVRQSDEFAIYNVQAEWSEEPCKSEFHGEYKSPTYPVAIGTVISVNETDAFLQLDKPEGVHVGSRVEISKLIGNNHPPLLKSIRIKDVDSSPVTLENDQVVDLLPYVSELIKPVVQKAGFYLHQ